MSAYYDRITEAARINGWETVGDTENTMHFEREVPEMIEVVTLRWAANGRHIDQVSAHTENGALTMRGAHRRPEIKLAIILELLNA